MAHSKLFSPSASHRWLTCTASAWLNADKERKSSLDADRGTELHKWMEANLQRDSPDTSSLPATDREDALAALKMAKSALEEFSDQLWLEKEVVVAGMGEIFGTVDVIAYNEIEDHLLILDYKFGYGEVDVEWNTQLLIYALGAIHTLELNPIAITLCIIQPQRSSRPQYCTLKYADLAAWVTQELTPAYECIQANKGTRFQISDEACRFCPSKTKCPERDNEIDDMLKNTDISGSPVSMLSAFDKLDVVTRIRDWCNSVESEAMALLLAGETDPRWKLVRGRANRRWKDEEAADKWLAARGLKEKERYTWKVIGIPAAESLVAEKIKDSVKLQNALGRLIEKPEGALTYARATDKRPAVAISKVEEVLKVEDSDLEDL